MQSFSLLNSILHLDVTLNQFVSAYGFWTYLLLFVIIFCETGLVVTPFLPGDSLLFAAGSIAAQTENSLNIFILFSLLFLASVLGNQINFFIGRFLGPRVFSMEKSWFFNKQYLQSAHEFYLQHGGKTLVFARFLPIIRTFAPFVAGIARMSMVRFSIYNVFSALLWIGSLLGLGYFLGSIPVVKNNFTLFIYGIILVSILPAFLALLKKRCVWKHSKF